MVLDKKEERKRVDNKYTRREFLKLGARAGIGATLYGAGGYFLGKGYQIGKDWYSENIQPAVESTKKAKSKIAEMYDGIKREGKILIYGEKKVLEEEKIQRMVEKEKIEKEEKERISRRGFLKYPLEYLKQVHKHPVPTLTITGVAYGAAKSTIKGIPKYLTNLKIAKLKDENTKYEERIGILEEYQGKLEREMKELKQKGEEYTGQIAELQKELSGLKGILENSERASGKLETIVEESSEKEILFLELGLAGLLVSTMINTFALTGFAVAREVYTLSVKAGVALFIFSVAFVLMSMRKKKTKIIKKNSYKFK